MCLTTGVRFCAGTLRTARAAHFQRQAPGADMTQASQSTAVHGSCHCGRVQVEFTTSAELASTTPRACDCSFCQKHGAAYVSDPSGHLRITVAEPDALLSYRQGSKVARFRLCSHCGVLVAVTFEHQGNTYGAVNASCLDERSLFGASVPASPQQLSSEAKISRWLQVWVPGVQVVSAGT